MKAKLKRLAKRILSWFNYFPFRNRFSFGGAKVVLKNTMVGRCKVKCKGKNNVIICHGGGRLHKCKITITGNNNRIEIGKNTTVIQGDFYMEDSGNSIVIGDNTGLCGQIHLACTEGTNIKIGDDCLFSSEIVFRTGDSHSLLDMSGNRINPAADITIGDHVWIGHRVLINKGVTVMPHSVIGTGAVVTKSAEKGNVCIAGVPAKIVKENVDWCDKRL